VFAPGTAPKPKRNKKKKVVQPGAHGQGPHNLAMQSQQVGNPFVQGQQSFVTSDHGGYQPQFQSLGSSSTSLQQQPFT
jgi:hypothetical protein